MKNDLISRQAAVKALEETKQSDPFNRYEYQNIGIDWSIDAIKALPSAQPEIIHCKDCKFYGRVDKRRFYRGSDCLNKRIDTIVPDRDFCSRGERKDGEHD